MNSHLYETKRKEGFKKTQQRRAYIYLLEIKWVLMTEKKWQEIRACREKFHVETKEKIYWEWISEFYEIFTITDLQKFMCTDEDAVRYYNLRFKWKNWFDTF